MAVQMAAPCSALGCRQQQDELFHPSSLHGVALSSTVGSAGAARGWLRSCHKASRPSLLLAVEPVGLPGALSADGSGAGAWDVKGLTLCSRLVS